MKYSVIHSKDPYLLARMATDLQMSGVIPSTLSTNYDFCNPFGSSYIKWIYINDPDSEGLFGFANHDCSCTPGMTNYELTEENYLQVLEAVLS